MNSNDEDIVVERVNRLKQLVRQGHSVALKEIWPTPDEELQIITPGCFEAATRIAYGLTAVMSDYLSREAIRRWMDEEAKTGRLAKRKYRGVECLYLTKKDGSALAAMDIAARAKNGEPKTEDDV